MAVIWLEGILLALVSVRPRTHESMDQQFCFLELIQKCIIAFLATECNSK